MNKLDDFGFVAPKTLAAFRGMKPEPGNFEVGIRRKARYVDREKCTGCETCVESCPLDAIAMKDGLAVVDADTCGDCGGCVDACPTEAISLE